jgi:cell division protein FtsQ
MTARARNTGRKRTRSLGIALFLLLAGMISIGVLAREWREHAVRITVEIRGATHATPEMLRKLAAVPDSTILSDVDLMAVRRRIEKHPFVETAVVRRDPPSTLVVEITERVPVAALLDVRTKDWFVDGSGVLLPMLPEIPLQQTPVITGYRPAGSIAAGTRIRDARLIQALGILSAARSIAPDMLHLFSEISLEGERDYVLYTLEAGVPVIFGPADRIEAKLRSFRAFWEGVAVQRDLTQLEYIDLRFLDQVVAKWQNDEGASAETEQPDPSTILPD